MLGIDSRRALDLAPQLAEAHASYGLAVSLTGQFVEAADEFEKALSLNPKSFEAAYFYARACVAQGKAEEAAKWYERATAVDPEHFAALMLLASTYRELGRRDDMTKALRRSYDAARKHLELNPDNPRALYMGAAALMELGERDKALDWTRRAEKMEPDDPSVMYNVACDYALLEMKGEALGALTKAIDNGFGHWKWIEHDTTLDSLRNEPEFAALLARKPAE